MLPGVRRIEALTANAARTYLAAQDASLRQAADLLRVQPREVPNRLASLLEERKKLERELSEAKKKIALGGGNGQTATENPVRTVGAVTMLARTVHGIEPKISAALWTTANGRSSPASSRSSA